MLKIRSNIHRYSVNFGRISKFLPELENKSNGVIYVIDSNVWKYHKEVLFSSVNKSSNIILSVSEQRKNLKTVQELYCNFIERAVRRNTTMVSIGGGILQDITGFVASTLYRGINWIFLPTTLLSQSDSCIGSKTSLNYRGFKNLIGTFYPPSEIFIDTHFLSTQKDLDYYSGLGEVVKLHIIGGKNKTSEIIKLIPDILFKKDKALLTAISNSLHIKKSYIECDEFDLGRRNLLNYGHCFGHAIETSSDFKIPHGQAVVIGMILANILAKKRNILSTNLEVYLFKDLLRPSLRSSLKKGFLNKKKIISAMKKDKKRSGQNLTVILLCDGFRLIRANDVKIREAIYALDNLEKVINIL